MKRKSIPIILASSSPRREKLLQQLNLKFRVEKVEVDESRLKGERPIQMVKRLAMMKLVKAISHSVEGVIITADTIVVLNNEVLGKPSTKKDAFKTLKKLSGKRHFVYTGFAVYNTFTNKLVNSYEKTSVYFRKMSNAEIQDYINTGSPMDKAGAYGIQDDFGAVFIQKICGCYYNVVGLPLTKVYRAIQEVSI
ncbi:MAG: septum formation protein Maf [Ignavibacteriaceae bacterium]|nr:septum formation protein Maf [Ignavibacteriaceae bacterium]